MILLLLGAGAVAVAVAGVPSAFVSAVGAV
jgi:hypothetical protein